MPSTMTLSYLVFPSGTPVPETQAAVRSVPDDPPQTLGATEQLTVAAAPGDPSYLHLRLLGRARHGPANPVNERRC